MAWEYDLKDIHDAAKQFWQRFSPKNVFAMHGEMGVGKTTFIHALCDELQVSSTVGSPTFSIINEYRFPGGIIYHVDLYRLKGAEEAVQAGVEECLYSGECCFVEWPERAMEIFPPGTINVFLGVVEEERRSITIGDK